MTNALRSLTLALASVPLTAAVPCEKLTALSLPDTSITVAQVVPAGTFLPPGTTGGRAINAYKDLPAFCRVEATLKPSSDSDIKVEVWLPMAGWNEKYQAVGNGGWAGVISYGALADALREGYATSSTDTGHVSRGGSFILGHPEKLIDYAWRSEHEMAVKSKAIIQGFYGNAARLSYWNGCSTGGRQGLSEAQRFPDDFDGIIAGAPANRTANALWVASAVLKDPASYIPPSKYPMIHRAVINACDALDGLKDGLITDPTRCNFDPSILRCKDADGPSCLTDSQVDAVKKIYSTATNPRTGQPLGFSSFTPGTELGWKVPAGGPEPFPNILDHYKYVVFKDPAWDWRTFNFDTDMVRSDQPENLIMNATDPNLKPFFAHGGRLLLYHGWSDTNVPTLNTIKYYKSVVDTVGASTSNNIRLFLEPGMNHCEGGEGPDTFDKVATLEQWVEKGKAPEQMIASHKTEGKVDRTRPLCPYPQVAKYKGTGSIDDAANFACVAP
jgi:feruloyl esterase